MIHSPAIPTDEMSTADRANTTNTNTTALILTAPNLALYRSGGVTLQAKRSASSKAERLNFRAQFIESSHPVRYSD
jgi:hypothetical protein